ncbi:hypothetical protein K1719_007847 [Acacia pycnantha]|nr:hypothetical protein K1719_007847 [Acacia pycnantha]
MGIEPVTHVPRLDLLDISSIPKFSICIAGNIDLLQQNQSEFLGDPTFLQNLGYDSVLSTPSSSTTPLNSSLTHLNNSSGGEERDSYCSNLFKFKILENLDLSDLL